MPPLPTLLRSLLGVSLAALTCLALGGCGGDERGPYPIETGRKREIPDRPVPPEAGTRERFGLQPLVEYRAPEGWKPLPLTRMRAASLAIPGEGTAYADVSVSRFHGGVLENVNRWRKQLGLEPVEQRELAALPKTSVFGSPAVRVELEGDFVGMRGGDPLRGYALIGLVEEREGARWFIKLVGPKALVDANRDRFDRFRASLRLADPESPEPQPPVRGLDPARLRWTLPPGWKDPLPTKGLRVRDFRVEGGSPTLEGVLSHLLGNGGGALLNVNRWRTQMGASELSDAQVAALPRIEVLGTQAVWVEIPGRYKGMSGENVPDALFLGMICLLEDDALFLRLIGPRAEVEARREEFKALCRSLRLEG